MRLYSDHQVVPNVPDPGLRKAQEKAFIQETLRSVVLNAYTDVIGWDFVQQQNEEMTKLYQEYRAEPSKDSCQLNIQSRESLVRFLEAEFSFRRTQFNRYVVTQPSLRASLEKVASSGSKSNQYRVSNHKLQDREGLAVYQILSNMFSPLFDSYQHLLLLDGLDSFCKRTVSAKEWISPLLLRYLNAFAMIAGCLAELYRDDLEVVRLSERLEPSSQVASKFGASLAEWDNLHDNLFPARFGSPLNGKFDYPDDDEYTKENIDVKRRAEYHLDQFWKNVDKGFKKYTGTAQHESIKSILFSAGTIKRTAKYIGASPSSPQSGISNPIFEYFPLSEEYHDPSKDITGTFDRFSISDKGKGKAKTRGTPDNRAALPTPPPPYLISKSLFNMDYSSIPIFRALFHSPTANSDETPSKIAWIDFVRVLTNLGFSAEKQHGSAWQFTPAKKMNLSRGIQFHEPHPGSEVSLILARRFGRRLNRAYGCEAANFKGK